LKLDEKQQSEFLEDLAYRYANKIPPGFMDEDNPTGGIGDLLIWKTILGQGKEQKKDFIFVTAEEKKDWLVRKHGTFQPRIELIEEYRAVTNGGTIHLVPLSTLLKLFEAEEKVVTSVQNVEEANTQAAILHSIPIQPSIEHYYFRAEISTEQAKRLAALREKLVRELAQTDEEIQNWTRGMGWLPPEQLPLKLPELRERQRQLKANIEWINQQLVLTPPPDESPDAQ
jgi:hypothetical protein